MNLDAEGLVKTVLHAKRKGFFRMKPIFKPYAATSDSELTKLQKEIGVTLPAELRNWLTALGYGDIGDELSFRREWFAAIDTGQLKGCARFAQDVLGNFYAFDFSGRIFYLSRSQPVFAVMSKGFLEFVDELVGRDYMVVKWSDTLQTEHYEW
jgi:hypothetical protein